MTDDKLERLRTACEGKKDITLPALELLNLIDMVQNYGAEIDRLHERRAACENERDTLRKVVWHLKDVESGYWIAMSVVITNNLDIAKLQREMGK